MPPDYDQFSHGGVSYPLAAATGNSLLQDADPALFYTLSYLSAVIKHYVGARFLAQSALENLNFPSAVEQLLHVEPVPLLANKFKFPTLAIYRKQDEYSEKTLTFDQDIGTWEYAFILPPLNPRQREQLEPILRSVSVVIRHAISQGFDPAYNSGVNVWELAKVQTARVASVRYGGYEHIEDIPNIYRAIVGTIVVGERDMPNTASFEKFDGFDVNLDHKQSDGTTLQDVVVFRTQQGPTFTSIVPNSGTKAGGTSFTITGARFWAPVRVLFEGGAPVEAVVVDAQHITGVTPAHAANPTFIGDVTVLNGDGQSVRAPAAFVFTSP